MIVRGGIATPEASISVPKATLASSLPTFSPTPTVSPLMGRVSVPTSSEAKVTLAPSLPTFTPQPTRTLGPTVSSEAKITLAPSLPTFETPQAPLRVAPTTSTSILAAGAPKMEGPAPFVETRITVKPSTSILAANVAAVKPTAPTISSETTRLFTPQTTTTPSRTPPTSDQETQMTTRSYLPAVAPAQVTQPKVTMPKVASSESTTSFSAFFNRIIPSSTPAPTAGRTIGAVQQPSSTAVTTFTPTTTFTTAVPTPIKTYAPAPKAESTFESLVRTVTGGAAKTASTPIIVGSAASTTLASPSGGSAAAKLPSTESPPSLLALPPDMQIGPAQPQGAPATNMMPAYIAAGVVGVGLLGYLAYRAMKKG